MRRFAAASCAVVSLALGGCIQSSTLVKLMPDGSGTVEQTVTMSAQAVASLTFMSPETVMSSVTAPSSACAFTCRSFAHRLFWAVLSTMLHPLATITTDPTRSGAPTNHRRFMLVLMAKLLL